GAASDGPLALGAADGIGPSEFLFVDLRTLKALPVDFVGSRTVHPGDDAPIRASADGRVFGSFRGNSSPQYIQSMVFEGKKVKVYGSGASVGHVTPWPDGSVLYTARGRYTAQARPIGDAGKLDALYCLPAVAGHYYLGLKLEGWIPGRKTK